MIIDPKQLTPQALLGVVDNFILREGTDYGQEEMDYDQKREALMRKINNGEAVITFDADTQTITILSKEETQGI